MEIKDFKIGVYLRTALKDDEEIKRQENLNLSYCRYRGYPEVVKIYKDNGKPGTTENRSAYKRLLKDVRDGKINVIVVTNFDRLTRQPVYFYNKMIKYITEKKLIVICVTNPISDEKLFNAKVKLDFAWMREKYSDGGVE